MPDPRRETAADLCALAAGLCWGGALPDARGAALAVVGAALAAAAVTGTRDDGWRGLLVGLVWYGLAGRWVTPALADYGVDGARAAWGALVLVQAGLLAPLFVLAGRLRAAWGPAALPLASLPWAGVALFVLPLPATPGILVVGVPALAGAARLGGMPWLNAAVLAVGAGLAALRDPATRRAGASLLAAAALITGLGDALPVRGPLVHVGLIQTDTGAFDGRRASTADARAARLMSHLAQLADADLIVTPESAWPWPWPTDAHHRLPVPLNARPTPLVLGAVDANGHQLVVGLEAGAEVGRVAKEALTPLSERPLAAWALDRLGGARGPRTLTVSGLRLGVLLCYEDLDARAIDAATRDQPDLLVLPAIDAWFGDGPGAAWHLAQARVVALTTGYTVLRPTGSGVSAVLLPDGSLAWSAPATDGDAELLPGTSAIVTVPAAVPPPGVVPRTGTGSALFHLLALGALAWRRPSASA